MQQCEGNIKAFTAGEDLEAFRRVKLSSGTVVYADAAETSIGITQEKKSSGESISVALKTRGRTFIMTAAEAFSANASLYGAADGKVQDTSTGTAEATSLEEATASGDQVECIYV